MPRNKPLDRCPKCGCMVFEGNWTLKELLEKEMLSLWCANNGCPNSQIDWYPRTGEIKEK